MESNNEVKYAGFWVRFLAAVIDGLILSVPVMLIDKLFGEDSWMSILLLAVLWWQYTAHMLSSSWRATIGKKVLGLEVLDTNLEQLTFTEASVRFLYSFISYSFVLPIFMMFFNDKKQTFHDYFAKTVVVDVATIDTSAKEINTEKYVSTKEANGRKENTKNVSIIGFVRTIGIIIVIGFSIYYLYVFSVTAFVFGSLAKHKQKSYDNSYHIKYQTNDYNDSRIIFYQKELETYSKAFIEAEGMYDIFASDTKRDLALNCIEAALKEQNVSDWIEMGSGFRRNARNKYANTEEKIKKAKKNEDYIGHHFYDYDLNDVNHIEDELASIWEPEKNKQTCSVLMPTEQMYNKFIYKYIDNREWTLANYAGEWVNASYFGTLNKSFYSKKKEKTQKWLDILYRKHPQYKDNKNKQEIEDEIYVRERQREEKEKKKTRRKKQTEKFIENLRKCGDDEGTIKMLQVQQIIGDKASIPHMGYRNKTGILKITIHGARCSDFVFPPKIQCESM